MSKTAFITGGSRGIGRACVKRFAEAGYSIAFTYNEREDAAFDLRDEIVSRSSEESVLAIKLDFDAEDFSARLKESMEAAKTYFGIKSFDVLILNAGTWTGGLLRDMAPSDIDRLLNVNLRSQIYAAKEFSTGMIEAGGGSIVIISSIWGLTGASCESVYSATKAGLIGFGKSLAQELGPAGVRVNMIAPGVIDTDMNSGYSEEEMQALAENTPLRRIGRPEDVASAAFFLSSDEAGFITGQVLGVDGGIIS